MIGPVELALANERRLVVLLHVPRSGRLLFATDFPMAAMRARRVWVMDHWVDVVLPGYPASAYRVSGDTFRAD